MLKYLLKILNTAGVIAIAVAQVISIWWAGRTPAGAT